MEKQHWLVLYQMQIVAVLLTTSKTNFMGRFISSVVEEPNSHKCVGICLHFIAAFENTALNVLSW